MAALAKDRTTQMRGDGQMGSCLVAATTKIYAGSVVGVNAGGFLIPAADAASCKVQGIADEQVDNSAGANGDLRCKVRFKLRILLDATSITQAMVGTKMYVVDDHTFDDATGTNSIVAGRLTEFVSTTSGWLEIDPIAFL